MRKQKGSLTFPSNPLARLQELRAEVEGDSNDASNEVSFEASTGTQPQEKKAEMRGRVRLTPAAKEPTSRLNVELRDSLHTRLKTYCVQRKIPIRMVIDALLEEFLTEAEQQATGQTGIREPTTSG
jgi:hypothetical protein